MVTLAARVKCVKLSGAKCENLRLNGCRDVCVIEERALTHFVRGSITVCLTSSFICLFQLLWLC